MKGRPFSKGIGTALFLVSTGSFPFEKGDWDEFFLTVNKN